MLGGRTADRSPGPPGRLPESAEGHRLSRMLSRTVGAAAALLLAAAAPAQAAKIERLSRPGKTSYFAFVDRAEWARAKPSTSARKVAKLTLRTPEATDDLVMVLDRTETRGRDVAARAAAGPAQRHDRLGAGLGAQRAAAGEDVAARSTPRPSGSRWSRTARSSSAPDRRRAAAVADAARAVLHPRQAEGLRSARARSTGRSRSSPARPRTTLTDWPGGGHRRRPRHEPARADPGQDLARLRADAQRRHPEAGEADAGRHAADHHLIPCRGRKRLAGSTSRLIRRSRARLAP